MLQTMVTDTEVSHCKIHLVQIGETMKPWAFPAMKLTF